MDEYMLKQNLRARGVSPDEINNVLRYGSMPVTTKYGTTLEVIKRSGWYYFL